jgi:hypothetical protein
VVAGRLFSNGLPENADDIVLVCSGSQRGFNVYFLPGKQTGFDFAVSGQSQAITGTAKMPADRCNKPDLADGSRNPA